MKMGQLYSLAILAFFFFLALPQLSAQENSYRYWRQEGIKRYESNDFNGAINAFRLAERMPDAPSVNDMYDWIARSFEGRIEMIDSLRRVTEILAKASELAGVAYKQAKLNPTHGLRIAEAAVGFQSGSRSALQQFHDIISSAFPPIYAAKFNHADRVTGIAMSPDEQSVVTACWDGTLRIWDVHGQILRELKGHKEAVSDVAFSPDGKWILSGSFDNTAILWTATGDSILTLNGHVGDVSALAFSPDSRRIATASWDGQVIIWSVNGSIIRVIKAHEDYLSAIAFSPGGDLIATGSWDKTAKIWDANGQHIHTIEGHRATVSSVAFSPDGKHLLTGSWDHTLKLWSLEGNLRQEFSGHDKGVLSVAFSPDGQYVLSAGDDNLIILWNLTGSKLQTYSGHNNPVAKVSFSSPGNFLLSASMDFTANLWFFRGTVKQEIHSKAFRKAFSIHLIPDTEEFLIGTENGAFLIDQSGNIVQHLTGHRADVDCVSASSDGKLLVTGGKDDLILLHDRSGKLLDSIRILRGVGTFALTFSPDNQWVAFGGRNQIASVCAVRGDSMAPLVTLSGHVGVVSGIAFSPDSKRVLTSSWDKTARLWDMQGNQLAMFSGHTTNLSSIAFSPDGQSFLTGSYDQTAKLWNLEGKVLASFIGHKGPVISVAFSRDGEKVLTTSRDGTIKIWNLEGQELQTLIGHQGPVGDAAFSIDDNFITSAGDDGTVRIWFTGMAFLKSGRVASLTKRQQYEYGIIDSWPEKDEQLANPIPAIPYHPEFKIHDNFKVIQASNDIFYHNYVGFELSNKAFHTSDIIEKLTMQQHGIDEAFAFIQGYFEDKSKANYRVPVYMCGQMAIWNLEANRIDSALAAVQRCTELSCNEEVRQLIQGKMALVNVYLDNIDQAIQIAKDVKNVALPSNLIVPLHGQVTGEDLGRENKFTVGDMLLRDIAYLKKAGRTHPHLDAFEKSLEEK